jgi:hypothetical protein
MFQDMDKELEGVVEQEDRLGGGSYLVPSAVYDAIIKMAYITDASQSKAQCVNLTLEVDGKDIRERIWITNREGKPTYEKENKKFMLPGYETINDLCLVATGHSLAEQDVQEKTIKVYDYDSKSEVDKSLPVITSILGKVVLAGVLLARENKQEKDGAGNYVNTSDTRDFNEFDKFFHKETRKTVAELKRGGDIAEEDMFISLWTEKNAGELRDRSKPVAGSGPAKAASGGASQGKSLFANN